MISSTSTLLPVLLVMLVCYLSIIEADSDFSVSSPAAETSESSVEHVGFVKQYTLSSTNTRTSDNDDDDDDGDDDDNDNDSSDDGDDKIDSILLQLPGRVFVSHISGIPTGVLGYVNVSGASQNVVNAVKVSSNDDEDELQVKFDTSSSSSGYLLTEIFLVTSNIVNDVRIESSAQVIIEDDVLVVSNLNKELQLKASDSSIVYVSSSSVSLQDLKLELSDSATLQFITDSISIHEKGQFQAHDKSSITVLTSSLIVDDLDLNAEMSGSICISADELTARRYDGQNTNSISLPNASSKYTSTGTALCDEISTPSRKSGCVFTGGCSVTSSTPTGNVSGTISTPTTTSSATTTPPSSGVNTSEDNAATLYFLLE